MRGLFCLEEPTPNPSRLREGSETKRPRRQVAAGWADLVSTAENLEGLV